MATVQTITPCLWFDTQAEEAVDFYCAIFQNSRAVSVVKYGEVDHEAFRERAGSIMSIEFELNGQRFIALNGGPQFQFNEALSLEVACETQQEVDYFWEQLTAGGEEGPCGWLKDRFGLSWQIVPTVLAQMLKDPDRQKTDRVTEAFLQMKKLNIAVLERAFQGAVS